eukprot:CAMPEP_0194159950 /NCGR_PEP_ID=MMETSP0152-20130528/78120_1 /TAXON_ID=1049557 /ORGANISM="Thalassiothrix antarctica, Strain L6-D1" /LENGTH=775 /DNA_ID=CAMNT_0038869585 /DNA_START=248 /DNA_END=2576 /DNA_ORIENTATION=-
MCGMQTPGTLIVDGGKFDYERQSNISQAIWRNIPNQRTPKLVLIPSTGKDLKPEEREKYTEQWVDKLGFEESNFYILHPDSHDLDETDVDDSAEVNTLDFVAPLLEADAVFIRGGPQRRLLDALKYTSTHQAMWNVLERGGVIAGTSAGASAQGFIMPRFDREWYTYGFGFLPNVAFDTHVDARDRWEDMYELLKNQDDPSSILGISISEKTAIVVQGNCFQVVGDTREENSFRNQTDNDDNFNENDRDIDEDNEDLRGTVAVYTCQDEHSCNQEDSPYVILIPGQWYNICSREVVSGPDPNLLLTAGRKYALPYDFRSDYRLAARRFRCSGRRCEWISSTIDIMTNNNIFSFSTGDRNQTMLRLTALIESDGDLENNEDFIKLSYRLSSNTGFNDPIMVGSSDSNEGSSTTTSWTTAPDLILDGSVGDGMYIVSSIKVIFPNFFRFLQIRIDAETSREQKSYIVKELKIEHHELIPRSLMPSRSSTQFMSTKPIESSTNRIFSPSLSPSRPLTRFSTTKTTQSPTINVIRPSLSVSYPSTQFLVTKPTESPMIQTLTAPPPPSSPITPIEIENSITPPSSHPSFNYNGNKTTNTSNVPHSSSNSVKGDIIYVASRSIMPFAATVIFHYGITLHDIEKFSWELGLILSDYFLLRIEKDENIGNDDFQLLEIELIASEVQEIILKQNTADSFNNKTARLRQEGKNGNSTHYYYRFFIEGNTFFRESQEAKNDTNAFFRQYEEFIANILKESSSSDITSPSDDSLTSFTQLMNRQIY